MHSPIFKAQLFSKLQPGSLARVHVHPRGTRLVLRTKEQPDALVLDYIDAASMTYVPTLFPSSAFLGAALDYGTAWSIAIGTDPAALGFRYEQLLKRPGSLLLLNGRTGMFARKYHTGPDEEASVRLREKFELSDTVVIDLHTGEQWGDYDSSVAISVANWSIALPPERPGEAGAIAMTWPAKVM